LEQVAEADRALEDVALMRYEGQGGELAVPWSGSVETACGNFAQAHQALYGFTLEAPVELVTLRVEAIGRLPAPVMPRLEDGVSVSAQHTRTVHFATGTCETPVLDRASMAPGAEISGPAIITQLDATTLVPPGWTITVHPSAALLLRRI
jgi:N-methylhydantoinase A